MNGIETTFIGNLGQDVELRFSAAGRAWARFRVAVTRMTRDASGEKREQTTWVGCKVFGDQAENLASSAQKGTRIMVTGHFEMEEWKDNNGEDRSAMVFVVDEVGTSLRWATASVARTAPGSGRSQGSPAAANGNANGNGNGRAASAVAVEETFGSPAGADEENPFL